MQGVESGERCPSVKRVNCDKMEKKSVPGVLPSPKPRFFAAVSDGFGPSVRETIFTYQVAVFKRHCITQRPLAVIVLSAAAVVVGKVGMGSDTMDIGVVGSGQRHAIDQLSATDLPNVHGAHCVINPIDTKVRFPALNPVHTAYGDVMLHRPTNYCGPCRRTCSSDSINM